jgi:hypothetical protein
MLKLTSLLLGRRFRRAGSQGPIYEVIGRYYPRHLDPDRPAHETRWVLQDRSDRIAVLDSELKNREDGKRLHEIRLRPLSAH